MRNSRILSKNTWINNDSYKTGLNNHDLVIGTSGGGKTSGYIEPNIALSEESLIITDTKGNLYNKLSPLLREKGYRVELFDMVNPSNSTVAYNPLEYIEKSADGSSYSEKDVQMLAGTLLPVGRLEREPYWPYMGQVVLSSIIGMTLEALPIEEQHMGSVVELARIVNTTDGLKTLEGIASINDEGFAAKKFEEFSSLRNSKTTWGCVISQVFSATSLLDSGVGKEMITKRSNFDFKDLGRERIALFINVSDNDRTFDPITNIMYTQILQQLIKEADSRKDSRLKVPVRVMLDDFACSAVIPDFQNLIAVLRSRNISVSIILQSITQLYSRYGREDGNTIVNNCDHILYLGGRDEHTCACISDLANVPKELVTNMPIGKAYVFERGSNPKYDDAFTWRETKVLIKREYEKTNREEKRESEVQK